MTYYVSILEGDPPFVQVSTSLRSVEGFTGLKYATLSYQLGRRGRTFYRKGNVSVYSVGEIVRIKRDQYKNPGFKR